jgi:hypothetical protein
MSNFGYVGIKGDDGNVYPFKMVDGKPRVVCTDYLYAISEGDVAGHKAWSKIGYNGDVDNVEEVVWAVGGSYTFPAAGGIQMEVVSSSGNDTSAGTGVQKVKITYLDNAWAEQTEEVTLNGLTPVLTTATNILRVNNFRASAVGTGGFSAGNIDVKAVAPTATIYSRIPTGNTRARNSVYTVPDGKTLFITSAAISAWSSTANKLGRFTLRANWDDVNETTGIFMAQFEAQVSGQSFYRDFEIPIKLGEHTDLYMVCISDAATSNVVAQTSLRGWME